MNGRRPTLAELAAMSNSGPWECPGCGCRDTRVIKTWYLQDGTPRRKRVCRNCGKYEKPTTSEVEVPKGFKVVVVEKDEEERACA